MNKNIRKIQTATITTLLILCCVFLLSCEKKSLNTPRDLVASRTEDGSVQLNWAYIEKPETSTIDFRVFRKESGHDDFIFIADTEELSFLDSTADFYSGYQYKVKAFSEDISSASISVFSEAVGETPEITLVEVLGNGEGIEIVWNDTNADYYIVYSLDNGESAEVLRTEENKCTVKSLVPGTEYSVRAAYTTSTGEGLSNYSKTVQEEETPTISMLTRLNIYNILLGFEQAHHHDYYEIAKSENRYGRYEIIGKSYDEYFLDENDDDTIQYSYKVRTVNGVSVSAWSEPVSKEQVFDEKDIASVPVFMYHEFVTQEDLDEGVALDEYAIFEDEFEGDLKYLKENGYNTITCQMLIDWLEGKGELPEKPVILSIDDGKLGVYKRAWPLLKKYHMCASLSVILERIDIETEHPDRRLDDEAPYCHWNEIKEMSDSGAIEIISHTYYQHKSDHDGRRGANIGETQTRASMYKAVKDDYESVQQRLIDKVGKFVPAMAYPYSYRSPESDDVWMQCGYKLLLAGDDRLVRQTHADFFLKEAGINEATSLCRRITRERVTPLSQYMEELIKHDQLY